MLFYYIIVRVLWRNIYKYVKPVSRTVQWIRAKYENTRYYKWKVHTKVKKCLKRFGKTYIVMGKKGTGKTSYFAWIANKYIRLGIPVLTNFYLKGCYKVDIEDFNRYNIENCVLLYDESGRKLNSRAWNSRQKIKNVEDNNTLGDNIYEFNTLARHNHMDVYYAIQWWERIDNTIRELIDRIYVLKPSIFNMFGCICVDEMGSRISISENEKKPCEEFYWVFFLFGRRYHNVKQLRSMFNSWEAEKKPEKIWKLWDDIKYIE
jgi:hypothetical protein